jgi:hypothetical protein
VFVNLFSVCKALVCGSANNFSQYQLATPPGVSLPRLLAFLRGGGSIESTVLFAHVLSLPRVRCCIYEIAMLYR